MNFPINLDRDSSTPIFQQISKYIKQRIEEGALLPGTRLPSTYALSEDLEISRATVVKSYDELISQGYLEGKAGGGTFVKNQIHANQFATAFESSESQIPANVSDFAEKIWAIESSDASTVDNEIVNFGAPPFDSLPLTAWKKILIDECRTMGSKTFEWTADDFGLYSCREAISGFLNRSRGMRCFPEQVLIFANCKEALMFISRLLIQPGDTVAVENPSYASPRNFFESCKAVLEPIDIDENGLLVSQIMDLKCQPKLIYTTPVQDPTGIRMSAERKEELVAWAEKKGVMIWEEGWEGDYNYLSPSQAVMQGMGSSNNVFYGYCFWKLLYPLVTLGVLVVPPQMVSLCRKAKQFEGVQFSMLEQKALARFIQDGHLERHISKSKQLFEKRRKHAIDSLLTLLRNSVEIPRQSASLHLCVRFSDVLEHSKILDAAQKAALPLASTEGYYLRNVRGGEFILPFTNLNENELRIRVTNFARLLKESK